MHLKHDKHVRVDILYDRYASDTKSIIKILSMLLLLLPFSFLFLSDIYEMVYQSYAQQETSYNSDGFQYIWMVKSILGVGVLLLAVQAISEILKAYHALENQFLLLKALVGTLLIGILVYAAWYQRLEFFIDPIYLMFFMALALLMSGFQVAFVFAASALFFAFISDEVGLGVLEMLPHRTYGIMGNMTLMAIPLFIFMGLVLEKSKMAENLLMSMGKLFGKVRGGLAISVVLVGAILAASTGIVGASVVMMSLIALPLMLKHNYSPATSKWKYCRKWHTWTAHTSLYCAYCPRRPNALKRR